MKRSLGLSVRPEKKFSHQAIAAVREKLPVSPLAGLDAMRLLRSDDVCLDQIDRVLKADPVISAHLIRVANSALLSYGQETRTVNQAIGRIGIERTTLHVCALAMKHMYSSPALQRIWNHSVMAAQAARQVAGMTRAVSPDEASLLGLIHDIGQIALAGLGAAYERARTPKLASGLPLLEAEEELCGFTHAHVGADMLASWGFPPDLVEAVRFHHTPSDCATPLAAVLYVTEHWLENQEDTCDLNLFRSSIRRLGISAADLRCLSLKHSPDLELLRFAA
jgi:HD-like signal output (HDOD) protein